MLTWHNTLAHEKTLPYFQEMLIHITRMRAMGKIIYPSTNDVFNAFRFTELNMVKVVIIGQDPYHGPNQAHGLAFSVKPGMPPPPSLINIYKELASDIPGFTIPNHGYLQSWAQQGVLLLNTILTVQAGKAHSHANLDWEIFTNKVITTINTQRKGIIFLLWGHHAKKKGLLINHKRHHVLTASHPSPLSAHYGFFGCRHFSTANQLLEHQNQQPINWLPILPVVL